MDYRRKIDRRDSLMRVVTMLIGIVLNCALAFTGDQCALTDIRIKRIDRLTGLVHR